MGVLLRHKSTETMQEIASRNFSIWNSAIQSGNPKEVAALYIADATFLPIVICIPGCTILKLA
ncbi:hypothetical protein ES705_08120 [subsurface metagenome]